MSNVLVEETSLQDIANAIREKTNSSDLYKPHEMAEAVLSIDGGSGEARVVTQEWEVTEFEYYDEFHHFMSVYNLPVLDYECTLYNYTFENNTENTRAGKYVNGIGGKAIDGDILKLEKGVRVGGHAGGSYGVDVYPGCKIILTQKYF